MVNDIQARINAALVEYDSVTINSEKTDIVSKLSLNIPSDKKENVDLENGTLSILGS